MPIDLTDICIRGTGPTSRDVKITTKGGEDIEGVSAIGISILPNALIDVTLHIQGAHLVDLEDLEASVKFDDISLVKELRRRGYEVNIDDSDIERELHQTDEQDQDTTG